MTAAKISEKGWLSTLKSFLSIGVIRGLTAVSQLIIIAVASQIFDKAAFGRFAIALAAARLLTSISGLGANSYLLKDVPLRQELQMGWNSNRSAALFFVAAPLAICLLAGLFMEWLVTLNSPYYPLVASEGIAVAMLGFLWANMMTLGAYIRVLRSSEEAMIVSELTMPAAITAALGLMWWANSGDVAEAFLIASALLATIQLMMLGWHLIRRWIPVGGKNSEHISLRDLTAYWATVMLNTITGQLDILIAGTIISPVTVGIYVIVKRLSNILTFANSIVVWMLAPQISRATAAKNHATLEKAARSAMKLTIIPAILLAIAIVATLPWWTAYFDIERTQMFYTLLFMMLGGTLFSAAIGSTILFATQTGMPGVAVRALSMAILVAAPVTMIAGSLVGIIGIALGQLIMILLMKLPVRRAIIQRQGFDVSIFNLLRRRY